MYVCLCNAVTDLEIRNKAASGESFGAICKKLGVASQCGKCGQHARQSFENGLALRPKNNLLHCVEV